MHLYCNNDTGREGVHTVGDQEVKCEGSDTNCGGGVACEIIIETCVPT